MYNDRRLNNLELSYFTAKLGELLMSDGRIVNSYSYEKGTEELPAPPECVGLRKWGDCTFHDATLQYSKAWTSEKVYEDLVQIFDEDLFSYEAGLLGLSTKYRYRGKDGKFEIAGILGICTDLYVSEDGMIKSKSTIPYESFCDKDFGKLVMSIKILEGV